MHSYYAGKHAIQYNKTWRKFSQKTLEAACAAIDVERLRFHAQGGKPSLRILDVGCGTGLLLERLVHLFPSAELYGIDASQDMLAQAQQLLQKFSNIHLSNTELSGVDSAGLPYPPAFFNLITCTNILHYLQNPAFVLRGLKCLLIEDGQLVLEDYVLRGFPYPWKLLEWAIRIYDPQHRSLFSKEEARNLCQQAGLQVVVAQTFPIDRFCQGWIVRATS